MDRQNGMNLDTQLDLEGLPRHIELTDGVPTYQMLLSDRVLSVVSGTGEDATGIVTMPSVAEAVGLTFYIVAPTGAAGDDVSVYSKETGAEIATYGDLDADGDHVMFFSTGAAWLMVYDGVA